MGDEAFVQAHPGALTAGAIGDLQIAPALPLGIQLRLQVVEQPVPAHGRPLVVAGLDRTQPGSLQSTTFAQASAIGLANASKLH
jgi:hypothetical protein